MIIMSYSRTWNVPRRQNMLDSSSDRLRRSVMARLKKCNHLHQTWGYLSTNPIHHTICLFWYMTVLSGPVGVHQKVRKFSNK